MISCPTTSPPSDNEAVRAGNVGTLPGKQKLEMLERGLARSCWTTVHTHPHWFHSGYRGPLGRLGVRRRFAMTNLTRRSRLVHCRYARHMICRVLTVLLAALDSESIHRRRMG
jgi:hypothetical protein